MTEGHMGKNKSDTETKPPVLLKRSPRAFHAPYSIGKEPRGGRTRLQAQKFLTIYPGVNPPPPAEIWDKVSDIVMAFVVNERGDDPRHDPIDDEVVGIGSVADIPAEAAQIWVERCGSLDNLRWWRDVETRRNVRARIEAQIDKIEERAKGRRKAS